MQSRFSLDQLKQTSATFEKAMLLASQQEQVHSPSEEQEKNAKEHSEKLLTIFGDEKSAWAYLQRYEKMCIAQKADTYQLIHDACLFTLPTKNAVWTKSLWVKIIQKHKPNGPGDFIMRILPLQLILRILLLQILKKLRSW